MAEHHSARPESHSVRFARFLVSHRYIVFALLMMSTAVMFYPTFNTILHVFGVDVPGPMVRVDTTARALWPDHPFIHAQDKFAGKFGTSSLVAVAVIVKDGTIFTPETLEKISKITKHIDGVGYDSKTKERDALRDKLAEEGRLDDKEIDRELDRIFPPYPVNHDQIQSVAGRATRVVEIGPDGSINSDVLMKKVPKTQEEANALRELVRQNPPYIFGRLVSKDEKGALIAAGFVTDRMNNRQIYSAVFDHVQKVKAEFEDANTEIYITGEPILRGWILRFAFEIGMYVILTAAMIFVLLFLYFRRLHGVLIPAICGAMTAIWGLGYCGWRGINFDPLVLVIPMIITARAISHTVQMAERFFEDYELLLPRYDGDKEKAKVEAASIAMGELIVPGTLGIITDLAGLLVIMLTTIPQMRDLGEFGAFWVASILITVEIAHPILICLLPAPHEPEHYLPPFMIRFTRAVGNAVTHPVWKYVITGVTICLFLGSTYVTLYHSQMGESEPGTPLLQRDSDFNVATAKVAEKFGGVDSLVVYANGDRDNAVNDSIPIRRLEEFERSMKDYTDLGASISLVPFLKGSWQMNHYGDPKWSFIPEHPGTVRAMVFQLQTNGPPGFLRPYMTEDGRDGNISFFYPDHKGDTLVRTVMAANAFIERNPLGEVIVRLEKDHGEHDAPLWNEEKFLDLWYYMLGPLLPSPRDHTLKISIRQPDGRYKSEPANHVSGGKDLPAWLDEFREAAIADYDEQESMADDDHPFTWPATLADWTNDDVEWWWESEEYGVRAIAVNETDLIVQDTKAVNSLAKYQETQSWTRGVQFVMAGGIMGILAAINDEVERSHIANILLIFFVIFVLHSITYNSVASGGIVFIQIATATLVSFAYMAFAGIGLNINTLPVQSVGVGIGVDYAIYIVDRIRQECVDTQDIDEAVRRAVRTTGMAVTFTATTITGGIILWSFSNLRYQADMALLLSILMIINMIGGIVVVPAFYSVFRPKVATALLTEEQLESLRLHKELEKKHGLAD